MAEAPTLDPADLPGLPVDGHRCPRRNRAIDGRHPANRPLISRPPPHFPHSQLPVSDHAASFKQVDQALASPLNPKDSPGNFWPDSTVLQRTLGRPGRFSREPRRNNASDSSGLVTVLQRTRAVLRRNVSVKQERDAKRRPMASQVVEKEGSARACATGIIDAWGVEFTAGPGRSEGRSALKFRWGNRRRQARRRGATTALEWRLARTPRRGAVSSAVTAGAARAPSPASAEVPGALRAAVRADRDSGRAQVHRQAIEPMIGPADGGEGSGAKHPAGDADHDDCHDDRRDGRNDRRRWRAARSAREDDGAVTAPSVGKRNGPRRRPDAGKTTRPVEAPRFSRRGRPECRATGPCRRGSR